VSRFTFSRKSAVPRENTTSLVSINRAPLPAVAAWSNPPELWVPLAIDPLGSSGRQRVSLIKLPFDDSGPITATAMLQHLSEFSTESGEAAHPLSEFPVC